jgi:hypothetical protein
MSRPTEFLLDAICGPLARLLPAVVIHQGISSSSSQQRRAFLTAPTYRRLAEAIADAQVHPG